MVDTTNTDTTQSTPATEAPRTTASSLFGVRQFQAVASLNVESVLVDRGEYRCTLVVTDVKVSEKAHTLNKAAGLLLPINSIIITVVQVWHEGGAIIPELNRDTKADQWIIIGPDDPNHVLTPAEKSEMSDRIERAERTLAPMYAFHNMTLTPDPTNGNRLAPLGKFFSDNWKDLLYKAVPVSDVVNQGKTGGWFHNYKPVNVRNAGDWAVDRAHAERIKLAAEAQAATKAASNATQAAQTDTVAAAQSMGIGHGGNTTTDDDVNKLLG